MLRLENTCEKNNGARLTSVFIPKSKPAMFTPANLTLPPGLEVCVLVGGLVVAVVSVVGAGPVVAVPGVH